MSQKGFRADADDALAPSFAESCPMIGLNWNLAAGWMLAPLGELSQKYFRADADDALAVSFAESRPMIGLNWKLAAGSKDRCWESESQRFSS